MRKKLMKYYKNIEKLIAHDENEKKSNKSNDSN